jgi:hypothetical protein
VPKRRVSFLFQNGVANPSKFAIATGIPAGSKKPIYNNGFQEGVNDENNLIY